jgi:hypothetical protein
LPARLAGGGRRLDGKSNAATCGKPTRTLFSVAKPSVFQFAVLIGVAFCTLVAKPAGRFGRPADAFASSAITRTLSAGVTPRLCTGT